MQQQPLNLGRRIVVLGVTGSGKTTLAQHLGKALSLGVVELDALRHATGWDSTPFDEMADRLATLLDGYTQGWVCEGSYRPIRDVYLSRCDTLIWLHLPWRVSFWRLLKRTLRRAWTKEPLYSSEGPRESWRMSFFSRQSILWWSIRQHHAALRSRRSTIEATAPNVWVYELRSPREVEALLQSVCDSVSATQG